MTEGRAHAEAIRKAKYEVLSDVKKSIDELMSELARAEKKSPTKMNGLKDAYRAVDDISKQYRSKDQIARDNAAYRAARDGGSPRGAAFVSADMKPYKL